MRMRGGLAGADVINTEVAMTQAALAAGLAPSGGSATEQRAYNDAVAKFRSDLSAAQQQFQDARRAALLASSPLMECWRNALYKYSGEATWNYAYSKSGDWKSVFAALKAARAGGATNVTGLSDDMWAVMCANADLGITPGENKVVPDNHCLAMGGSALSCLTWQIVSPPLTPQTFSYLGGYSATWDVIFYGDPEGRNSPAPNYATPSANSNTAILTNFGLMGFDQYLMGVAATKFVALLAKCPHVPETQYWMGRIAPLTLWGVTQSNLEAANTVVQYSTAFFRAGSNIKLLTASAAAGGESAAAQEGARQGALGALTSSSLFWPVLIGAALVGGYFILRKKPSAGGAK